MSTPTLTPITYNQVLRELREIIASYPPGHRYLSPAGTCLYAHVDGDGNVTPGCLIGQWLHRYRGVSLHDLHIRYDRDSVGTLYDNTYSDLPDHPIRTAAPVTAKALALLCHVQRRQDQGMAWDRILDHSDLRFLALDPADGTHAAAYPPASVEQPPNDPDTTP